MAASVTIDWIEKAEGVETIKSWGQIECLDGDRVESYEVGVKTIELLGAKQAPKGYIVVPTVYNKGQFDNYAIWHIYVIDEETGTIRQLDDPYLAVEFGFECVGE